MINPDHNPKTTREPGRTGSEKDILIHARDLNDALRPAGQECIALNGGPQFKVTEAVSFFVACQTQEEIDYYREKLSAGGTEQHCGWLKDKFGLSWQVVPSVLGEMLADAHAAKSQRVVQAMLQMVKLAIQRLKDAGAGK